MRSEFRMSYTNAVLKNPGFLRAINLQPRNPLAILISKPSLHAAPKNEIPTGSPRTNPAGTP